MIFYVTAKLLEEGVAKMEDIDVGAKVGLRWRKGPFELMNQLGIDKALALVEDFLRNWPDLEVPENLRGQGGRGEPWDIRYVTYRREENIGRVTIARPEALNAITPP